MKFTSETFVKPCGCRSAGECGHNSFAEFQALDALVDAFAAEMKKKLRRKAMEGYSGWDNPDWLKDGRWHHSVNQHMEKGDSIDIANFAAFKWNAQL